MPASVSVSTCACTTALERPGALGTELDHLFDQIELERLTGIRRDHAADRRVGLAEKLGRRRAFGSGR